MTWIWVWTVSACFDGDIAAIVAWAKAHRVGLIVKTHDGATSAPNGYLGFRLIEECQKAGVPVRAWGYWWPWIDAGLQADFAMQAGVDYIADAEGEYDGERAAAAAMVDALLARRRPGQILGCAPLPIVGYHDDAGQYEEWNRLDVICPQAYAGTGGRDAVSVLDWTEREFARFQKINLEPCVYAADQPAEGLRSAILASRAKVQAFGADGDLSIWSLQHLTVEHIAVIDEFTLEDAMTDQERAVLAKLATRPDLVIALVDGADTERYILHGANDQGPGSYADTLERIAKLEGHTAIPAAPSPPPASPVPPAPVPLPPLFTRAGQQV